MIYFCTVHYNTDRWIDIQLNYLKKHVSEPYKVFSYLCGNAISHKDKFDFTSTLPINEHSKKLNLLAEEVMKVSDNDDDIIIFIDSDAFPIEPLFPTLSTYLNTYPLVAIQRIEDNGEPIAHPCFCATTIKLWKRINGTWEYGVYTDQFGTAIEDTGGKLLQLLNAHNIKWKALLKSNGNKFHYTHFSVYDSLVYHHGAGSRSNVVTRADREQFLTNKHGKMPFVIWKFIKIFFYDYYLIKQKKKQLLDLQKKIFNLIKEDRLFYKKI